MVRADPCPERCVVLGSLGDAEVADFEDALERDQYICRFQIQVNKPGIVNVFQALNQIVSIQR